MKLEIYYDLLFLEVAIWNCCTLWLAGRSLRGNPSVLRICLGATSCAVAFVLTVFSPFGAALKVLLWMGEMGTMASVTLGGRNLGSIRAVLGAYLRCSILLGSAVVLPHRVLTRIAGVEGGLGLLLPLELLGTTAGTLLLYFRAKKAGRDEGFAILDGDGKHVRVKAFIDTGNSLYEPISGKPVCVLQGMDASALWGGDALWRAIPYHTVGVTKGILRGYYLPDLILELGGPPLRLQGVFVAVRPEETARENEEACLILPPKILTESTRARRKTGKGERAGDHAITAACKIRDPMDPKRQAIHSKAGRGIILRRRERNPSAAVGSKPGDDGDRSSGDRPKGGGAGDADRA